MYPKLASDLLRKLTLRMTLNFWSSHSNLRSPKIIVTERRDSHVLLKHHQALSLSLETSFIENVQGRKLNSLRLRGSPMPGMRVKLRS